MGGVKKLQLRGNSIITQCTGEQLYYLTQEPLLGTGSTLGILIVEQSSDKHRHLYEVKPTTVGRFKDLGIWDIASQGGPGSYAKGASLTYGKRSQFFGRCSTSWSLEYESGGKSFSFSMKLKDRKGTMVWCDELEQEIAQSSLSSTEPVGSLSFVRQVESRTVHRIVTAWCAILWQANQHYRQKENQKKYNLFGAYAVSVAKQWPLTSRISTEL